MKTTILTVDTPGRGLHEITTQVRNVVRGSRVMDGLCVVYLRHTSASLIVQENADPSARADLEAWMDRHVPDGDPMFTHTAEGVDDMAAHVRAAITATSLSIPVVEAAPLLGQWQGIYLWEHRHAAHRREIAVHVTGRRPHRS